MLASFVRWSGYASIIGALLFLAAVILHPLRDGLDIQHSGDAYGAIHNLGVYGLILQLLGLFGLYIREAEALGKKGVWSFIVVFFGQVLYICLLVVDGLRNPLLAKYAPNIVHTMRDSDPNIAVIVLPALLLFFTGYLLFGTSLLRSKSLPRLGSWLISIGGPLYIIGGINIFILGPASATISIIEIAGALPLALGYLLLGYSEISIPMYPVGAATQPVK